MIPVRVHRYIHETRDIALVYGGLLDRRQMLNQLFHNFCNQALPLLVDLGWCWDKRIWWQLLSKHLIWHGQICTTNAIHHCETQHPHEETITFVSVLLFSIRWFGRYRSRHCMYASMRRCCHTCLQGFKSYTGTMNNNEVSWVITPNGVKRNLVFLEYDVNNVLFPSIHPSIHTYIHPYIHTYIQPAIHGWEFVVLLQLEIKKRVNWKVKYMAWMFLNRNFHFYVYKTK